MKTPKRRVHLTIPPQLWDALEALAAYEGRTTSEVVEDIIRQHLKSEGLLKPPTPEQLENSRLCTDKQPKQRSNKPKEKRLNRKAA